MKRTARSNSDYYWCFSLVQAQANNSRDDLYTSENLRWIDKVPDAWGVMKFVPNYLPRSREGRNVWLRFLEEATNASELQVAYCLSLCWMPPMNALNLSLSICCLEEAALEPILKFWVGSMVSRWYRSALAAYFGLISPEAARVVLFLASPLAAYVTRTCIECTRGRSMWLVYQLGGVDKILTYGPSVSYTGYPVNEAYGRNEVYCCYLYPFLAAILHLSTPGLVV